ncbi:hypothetical protein [Paenibacillus agricola]|uniref:Uncharacterized protein n=1 Tax=Paenibacillus agricola TaxID=2716264 RepID=A0ABX0JB39_9BACL|nr:hypothetical protein [Paenibacillus agricola]NHN31166.1 hypothetical protein [Paenibacillus agricola]
MERLHTMPADIITYQCPKCQRKIRVLADEVNDHGCICGWEPEDEREFNEELCETIGSYVKDCVERGLIPDAFAFSTIHLRDYGRVPGEVIDAIITEELVKHARN